MLKLVAPIHWFYSTITSFLNEEISSNTKFIFNAIITLLSLVIFIMVVEEPRSISNTIIGIITVLNYYVLRMYDRQYLESRKRK